MKKISAKILITVLAIFLLSSCVDPGRACNLVSDEEMKTLMEGEFTKNPVTELPRGSEGCSYLGKEGGEKTINFIIGTSETAQQVKDAYDNAVAVWESGTVPNRTYKNIEGIGTEAFWAYSGVLPQFITHQNNRLIIITLGRFERDEAANLEKAKKLAQLLLATE